VPTKNQNIRQADFRTSYARPSHACLRSDDVPQNTVISTVKAARGLLKAGHSISDVAEWTRLPFATLFQLRDGRRKKRKVRWQRLSPERIAAIRKAYLSGKDWYQIAEEFDCCWSTVQRHVQDLRQ
jgi:hypothetical protein